MDRVGPVTQMLWVRVSGPAGIVGGGSECPALSLLLQYHDWGETLEQGTEPPIAPRFCVCVCVCARTWMS